MLAKFISIVAFFVFQISFSQSNNLSVDNNLYDYETVNVQPMFPGGIKEFISYVGKNFTPPEVEGLSGVVKIDFVIEKNGMITNVKIVADIGYGSGEEAKRVISKSPAWEPGEEEGKKVRVIYHNFLVKVKN
jgi:periplasmic protein TonB